MPSETAHLEPPALDSGGSTSHSHVWYAAYGSNMHQARLDFYLQGGRPPGAARTYPGCRDSAPPLRSVGVTMPGRIYFAFESKAWTGGMALYDPAAMGSVAARAYLVSVAQFSDIAAQEMYREPLEDLDLTEVLSTGRSELGPGRYETLVYAGRLDSHPVLTFTAPWKFDEVEWSRPAERYLRHLAAGLAEAHGWSKPEIAAYLADCPGVFAEWSPGQLEPII